LPAHPVAPDVWRITTPLSFVPREVHAYLVRLQADRWMLVDGGIGTEEAWEALDAGVTEAAGGWNGVCLHVITHMHVDHVGLAVRALRAAPAPLAMGALDAERMAFAAANPEDEAAYRASLLRRAGAPEEMVRAVEATISGSKALAPPFAADVLLRGEDGDLPGAPGWRWVWTPGHTAGHVSLHRPADGVLIAGDAVLPRITPTLGVNRQRADPVGDYVAALERLEALAPVLVLGGHGAPTGPQRIRELRDAAEAETEAIDACLDGGPMSTWEVVKVRYPGRELAPSTRMLAIRETRAHLDRLAAAGRAVVHPSPDGAEIFTRPS
jgi:glyoxylase-like metal-dependent hydrolase (beta-lactamase superfamily II)